MEERERDGEKNTAQWAKSKKGVRAIKELNRSQSSRQRAHINSTPGDT